jgi:hypothetical protein
MVNRHAGSVHPRAAVNENGLRKGFVRFPDLFEIGIREGWMLMVARGHMSYGEPACV